jgi:hypothetical protein
MAALAGFDSTHVPATTADDLVDIDNVSVMYDLAEQLSQQLHVLELPPILEYDPDVLADFGILRIEFDNMHQTIAPDGQLNDQADKSDDHAGHIGAGVDGEDGINDGNETGDELVVQTKKKKSPEQEATAKWEAIADRSCCGKQCLNEIGREEFERHTTGMLHMSQSQRRATVIGVLLALVGISAASSDAVQPSNSNEDHASSPGASPPPKRPTTNRNGPHIKYTFRGIVVCRIFFLALMCISTFTLAQCVADIRNNEALSWSDTRGGARTHTRSEFACTFLVDYAERFGLPNPSARLSTEDQPAVFLDITLTKQRVYEAYKHAASGTVGMVTLSFSMFRRLWAEKFKWLQIATKKTDFCNTCTKFLEAGIEAREALSKHLKLAKSTREFIRGCVQACTDATFAHITFDFAQSVRLPSWLHQPKAAFFQAGAITDLFAVASDATLTVWTYVLAESHWPGTKDANTVCSMLLHRLTTDPTMVDVKTLYMQADNCCGQNKNQFLFKFLAWLVAAAPKLGLKLTTIEVNFGIAGHTKNFCDAIFGLVKRQLRKIQANTPGDVYRAVEESTKRTNIPKCGTEVRWLDVKKFVSSDLYFKDGLSVKTFQVHHVLFSVERVGELGYRNTFDDDWCYATMCRPDQVHRLKNDPHSLDLFEILEPKLPSESRTAQLTAIERCWERPTITVAGMLSPARSI